ncbi:MAG TPA: choline ABC transporter substrate-binding protein [Ancylobacter sp.]
MSNTLLRLICMSALVAPLVGTPLTAASAADPAACATVRMSDPGWTDITSTNAIAGVLLDALGYKQKVETLAVPVTFEALKNGQLDVFLGNWMPAQKRFVEPLTASGDIVTLHTNLAHIRFTLAVPKYVADAGVASFDDLGKNPDKFDKKIYGIEPGAPANQNIQKMITAKQFGLDDWTLVESSEQGMLSQVSRAAKRKEWIAFLAWEPHPMNTNFPLVYLSGGDELFGANYGASSVHTITRKGYAAACPNATKLFNQLIFSVPAENAIMGEILDNGADAKKAATAYIKANPSIVTSWLDGVTTLDGKDGMAAAKSALGI